MNETLDEQKKDPEPRQAKQDPDQLEVRLTVAEGSC